MCSKSQTAHLISNICTVKDISKRASFSQILEKPMIPRTQPLVSPYAEKAIVRVESDQFSLSVKHIICLNEMVTGSYPI